MSTPRLKAIVLTVLAIGAVAIVWAFTSASPRISMTVRGFTAKQWDADLAKQMGSREYVVAAIELTNGSGRPITYWGRYESEWAEHSVLLQTPTGWKDKSGWRCGTGLRQYTLAPLRTITFDAMVEQDKPCKVALNFSDGRKPSPVWRRLPQWLTQRLPWGREWSTVTTDAIDLRGALGLTVKREALRKPPEEIPAIRAAANSGDTEAQFRLAGRYMTGSGLEKSLTEAVRWFERAATNGHAEAAYNLGTIHEYGLGVPSDQAKAIEWYLRASDREHAGAQARLQALIK